VSIDVLGYLVEKLSGISFGEFLRTRLFEPLGMNDTAFWVPSDKTERLTSCYQPEGRGPGLKLQDDARESTYAAAPRLESGGGGLVSTAQDYLHFCRMMLNGGTLDGVQILSPKTVAPVMKAQGWGRIVNISSVSGIGPTGSSIAYAVSKAGLIHLTRCMAVALAPETLVNCVAPGLLEGTRATANLRPEFIERSATTSLLKKPADKDDCADMAVTMCRTETMTGQTVVIDSGRYFH